MSIPQSENNSNSSITLTSENFNQNWQFLGDINLIKICPENFQKTLNYWSFLASNIINAIHSSSNLSILNVIQLLKISRISILLTQKSFQNGDNCSDPITFLSGLKKPSSTPDIIEFPLLNQSEIPETVYYFSEVCKHILKIDFSVDLVINCSIYLSMLELNFSEDSDLLNHFNTIFGCSNAIPDDEIQNILNFDTINSLLKTLRRIRLKMSQPAYYVLRYLYERVFNYRFKFSYTQANFYQNLLLKGMIDNDAETILLTCFNYIGGDPVQFDPSKLGKNQIFFCYLCLNNLVVRDDKETFISKFSFDFDPWIFISYAYYISINTNNFADDFLNFLYNKEMNEAWKSAFLYVVQSKNIKTNLEREYLYIKNVISLFSLNDSKDKNSDSDEKPKQSPKIPEKINDDLTAPILFWYKYFKVPIKIEVVIELLDKLNSYFRECLEKTVSQHPLFYHSESLEFHYSSFPVFISPSLPTKPEDFLTASQPLPPLDFFTNINLILSQILDISIQFKYSLPANLLTSFCCNYYISFDIKDKIFSLNDTNLNEKATESNLSHLDKIFNEPDSNPDKYKCIQLVSPILSILPFSYDFIIRLLKSDDKYLPIINQIFENSSFLKGIDSLEQTKIETMLKCSIERNYQNIAKRIITNVSDTNYTSSLITSIAFTNPSIALFLYKSVSGKINPSQIITKLSDYSFPTEFTIITELINFLISISQYLDRVPFTYEAISVTKRLPTTWEEDYASKSNEVLTKAFINIWEFPPMTKEDVQKYTQKVLSSSEHSHHMHEVTGTIFDRFSCTYKKGQIVQPCFYCHTCGLVDRFLCCLGCAMTCHRGHDLVYVRSMECQCDCFRIPKMCIFNPKQENLYSSQDITAPNIEMTLENLHNLIDEGGDISYNQRQLLSVLFNNERIPEIQVTKPYFGKNGEYEEHGKKVKYSPHLNDERISPQIIKSDKNSEKSDQRSHLDQRSILNLFLKLSSIRFDEKSSLSCESDDSPIELAWQDVVKIDRSFNFVPVETPSSQPLVNWNELQRSFAENDMITSIMQRCIISPLNLAAFVSNNILVVSSGRSLVSYRSPALDKKLSAVSIAGFITQISPCKSDASLIAVSTLFQVYLIKVEPSGTFSVVNDKIIKFQKINNDTDDDRNIDSSSIVLGIFWLKSSQEPKFAVLLRTKMLFYEKGKDEPYLTLVSSESESIRSAVIVENNNEELAIVTLESGKYVMQVCSNKPSENEKVVKLIDQNKLKSFPWLPEKPIIAYCRDTGLFFVTSSGDEIACFKKDDLFKEKPLKPFMVDTFGAPGNLIFVGNHPKRPNLYVFMHVMSGGVATIEIGRSKIEFSLNESRFDGYRFPILTKDASPLTIFKGTSLSDKSEVLFSISLNGNLNEFVLLSPYELKKRKSKSTTPLSFSSSRPPIPQTRPLHRLFRHNVDNEDDKENSNNDTPPNRYQDIFLRSMRSIMESNDQDNDIEIESIDLEPQIKVPPVFWTNSRLSTDENIHIFIPNFDRDSRAILQNEKIIFNHNLRKKFIEVCCQSDIEVIIGFRFLVSSSSSSSHRPPYLALNGRVTKVEESRWYMLPLAANEIEPRKVYRVDMGSRGGLDINCDGFGVFVIERSLIEESISMQNQKLNINFEPNSKKSNGWFSESSSLFSFNDSAKSYGVKSKNNSEEEDEDDEEIDINEQNLKKSLVQLSFLFDPKDYQSDNSKSQDGENEKQSDNDDNGGDGGVKFDDELIKSFVALIYTNQIASIPARRILLRMIFYDDKNKNEKEIDSDNEDAFRKNNQKVIRIWSNVMQSLLKEKKVLPELWDVFLRDYSLMPKEEQIQISDLLWDNKPQTGNEFAFFSAFVS